MTWRAQIKAEPFRQTVDLYLVNDLGNGDLIVLDAGGGSQTLVRGAEAVEPDLAATLSVPEHALHPLLAALSRHLGAVEHPEQLRADYVAERARVDRFIAHLTSRT